MYERKPSVIIEDILIKGMRNHLIHEYFGSLKNHCSPYTLI